MSLRVINEDRVIPGAGFPRHGHRDMDIISYVLEGELAHKDSIGNGTVIKPGEIQRMSAGTGIEHSEFNPSPSEPVHFLQIWIIPKKRGIAPSYEQKPVPLAERRGKLRLVAAPEGQDGAVMLHQDARVYIANLAPGERVAMTSRPAAASGSKSRAASSASTAPRCAKATAPRSKTKRTPRSKRRPKRRCCCSIPPRNGSCWTSRFLTALLPRCVRLLNARHSTAGYSARR